MLRLTLHGMNVRFLAGYQGGRNILSFDPSFRTPWNIVPASSLIYADAFTPELAPAYDIVSTRVYIGSEQEFALKLGKTKNWYEVGLEHFESWAERADIPWRAIKPHLLDTLDQARTLWPTVDDATDGRGAQESLDRALGAVARGLSDQECDGYPQVVDIGGRATGSGKSNRGLPCHAHPVDTVLGNRTRQETNARGRSCPDDTKRIVDQIMLCHIGSGAFFSTWHGEVEEIQCPTRRGERGQACAGLGRGKS